MCRTDLNRPTGRNEVVSMPSISGYVSDTYNGTFDLDFVGFNALNIGLCVGRAVSGNVD